MSTTNPTNFTTPTMPAHFSLPFAFGELFRGRPAPLIALALALLLTLSAISSIALVSCSNGSAQAPNEDAHAGELALASPAHVEPASPAYVEPASPAHASPARVAQASLAIGGGPCPCPFSYLRTSTSVTIAKGNTHVEADTDSGNPLTVTLPASPDHLERHEIWLGAQPGIPNGSLTIDPNGQAVALPAGLSLTIPATSHNEGLVLLFVQPQPPPAGGYWRVSRL